jgi:hypothetical protein
LRLAQREAPSLHPLEPEDSWNLPFRRLVYEGLVRFDTASAAILPGHAERWEITADGRTYTFHLRPDRKYASGAPIRAADYARALGACFARQPLSPARARFWSLEGARSRARRRGDADLGIEAPDDRTLIFRLSRADDRFLEKLAYPSYAIPLPEGEAAEEPPPASGPYRWEMRDPYLYFVRNPHYGGDQPSWCDTIAVRLGTSSRSAVQLAAAGRLDVLWPEPPAARARLHREPELRRVGSSQGAEWCYLLVLNSSVPPTSRLPVRRAVAAAIDRRDLGPPWIPWQDLAGGEGGGGEFPGFDVDRAASELAAGRLPRGLTLSITVARDDPEEDLVAALVPGLGRAGVHAELRRRERSAKSALLARPGGFVAATWGERCAPGRGPLWEELFLNRALDAGWGGNLAHFREAGARLDTLLLAAAPAAGEAARRSVATLLAERVPVVPLARVEEGAWVRPRVRGLRLHPVLGPLFAEAWIGPEALPGR